MQKRAPRPVQPDPLLFYIDAELARAFPPDAIPEERDQHYRALLEDLRARAEKDPKPEERSLLAQRANAVAHLRLEDARANLRRPAAHVSVTTAQFTASIRKLRRRAGLSQSELAKRSGIDPAYVNRMEKVSHAEPVVPSRNVVLAIASALELSQLETDALLATAGYLPSSLRLAGGWQPEFALLANFLCDPLLTELDRAEFRQVLRALISHWGGPRGH